MLVVVEPVLFVEPVVVEPVLVVVPPVSFFLAIVFCNIFLFSPLDYPLLSQETFMPSRFLLNCNLLSVPL